MHVINKQSCRDKELMFFVRRLVLVCFSRNIVFKAKHIPGVRNKLADSLSWLQLQTFHQLAPAYMHPSPTEIPAATQLANVASLLLRSSLQPSSIPTYKCAWQLFHQFHKLIFQSPCGPLPISPPVLALFIAYLFDSHYAVTT